MKRIKDPIPLDNGMFPRENYSRNLARARRAETKFGSPAITEEQMKGIYDVAQGLNSVTEPTLCFRHNRKFI